MTFLFLPKLKEDTHDEGSDVQPGSPGRWEVRPPKTFLTVANSLDTGGVGDQLRTVTSIPSIWARALLVETALHNQSYPLRDLIIEQWQGMLAAIALADIRSFDIKVQHVKLEDYINKRSGNDDPFARSLLQLLPQPKYALYQLDGKSHSDYNPWKELYVFLWKPQSEDGKVQDRDYRVVGISSPSTLVCPAEMGKWTGLKWYEAKGHLSSPVSHLNDKEKFWLHLWLKEVIQKLPEYSNPENSEGSIKNARANIIKLLEQFQNNLNVNFSGGKIQHVSKKDYFGIQMNRGALELFNSPIKASAQPSNVQVIPSVQKEKTAPYLLLIDPKIDEQWNKQKQDIWIYEEKTLATANLLKDLKEGKLGWKDRDKGKVELIYGEDLLLPEFYFINREDGLFRTLNPEGAEQLRYDGYRITSLMPINSRLLDYFTASDLSKMLILEMNGEDSVDVSLSIPLSGFEGDSPKTYYCSRTYPLRAENALEDVPVLEFWPNFQASDWKEYYLFYFDRGLGRDTFSIELKDKVNFQDIQEEQRKYQIYKLKQFPEFINCYRGTENFQQKQPEVGVIFLQPPKNLSNNHSGKWKVGVDFGTSFTNVYFSANDIPKRLDLQPRLLQLADIPRDVRDGVLIEFFIPDNLGLLQLHLASVLTIRPFPQLKNLDNGEQLTPFLDGRIFIPPDSIKLRPQEPYIKTGLKWSEDLDYKSNTELFLKHLALEITALAKSKGVNSIEWFVSYPSAFSHTDKITYSQIWDNITDSLQQTTGIDHTPPSSNGSTRWRSESIAMAQYFVDKEDKQLVYATCIDIGGGTSDISIIEYNELLYQCSIQLAGYHLLTQFMQAKPDLLAKLFDINFDVNEKDWTDIIKDKNKFAAKFDVLLRRESEKFLKNNRQTIVAQDDDFQTLLQLMALGSAGLYYYIGIILRVLNTEGKYIKGDITPVYLGGNGARIFDWLATGGKFKDNSLVNLLFKDMLLLGSGWEMPVAKVTSYLSSQPKAEVACGLVLSGETDETKLKGWDNEKLIEDSLIAGEFCQVNGQDVTPYERMPEISDEVKITNFQVDKSLRKLKAFVAQFNEFIESSKAIKELSIKPIIVEDQDYEEVNTELDRHILK
ncbi:MAG: hypothetical protein AB4372_13705, partial [Xenococcus sp. (in: cyanobacteria)]